MRVLKTSISSGAAVSLPMRTQLAEAAMVVKGGYSRRGGGVNIILCACLNSILQSRNMGVALLPKPLLILIPFEKLVIVFHPRCVGTSIYMVYIYGFCRIQLSDITFTDCIFNNIFFRCLIIITRRIRVQRHKIKNRLLEKNYMIS